MDNIIADMMRIAAIQRAKELNDMCPWWSIEDIVETLSNEGLKQPDGTDYNSIQVNRMLKSNTLGAEQS